MTGGTDETDMTDTTDGTDITRYAIGIDAGGTRTTAVLVGADGVELGRAQGSAGAVRPGEAARAAATILATARRAASAARIALPTPRAVVGAAGAGREREREQLAGALRGPALLAREVRVMGDVELVLHAAFESGPGIVVAAGTGSAAYARTPDGVLCGAGGHGWQLGDAGGGYWLGRRALALVSRARDGIGNAGTLPERLLDNLALPSWDDLVRWAATADPSQVAALARDVLGAARDGDGTADGLVREAAAELAALAGALRQQFPATAAPQVALAGGLLGEGSPLRAALAQRLAEVLPGSAVRGSVPDPALAAARLALAAG